MTYESHQCQCIILTQIFVPKHKQFIANERLSFSSKLLLFCFGSYDNHETLAIIFGICSTNCVKSFMVSVSQVKEIWQIILYYEMIPLPHHEFHCSRSSYITITIFFVISPALQLYNFKTAWRIFMIRVSFFTIFQALSNKRNLSFSYNSRLRSPLYF